MSKRRRWWVRLLQGFVVAVVVVVVAAAGYVGYLAWRVPSDNFDPLAPGTLTVAPAAATDATTGFYRVHIADGTPASISVLDTSSGATVWRSDPGAGFLAASVGEIGWQEKFGYFWADVKRTARLTQQTVDEVIDSAGVVQLKGSLGDGRRSAPYTLTLATAPKGTGQALGMSVTVGSTDDGHTVSSVLLASGRDRDEAVHGFGEQYRSFDLDGTVFPVLVQEQGIGRGQQPLTFLANVTNWAGGNLGTTYSAWPTYVTSANRSLQLTDTPPSGAFGIADLSRPGQIRLESWSNTLTAEALAAATPAELVAARADGTVREPLATWVQDGAVLGLQGGTSRVQQIVAEMQASGAAISGVWLQDWVGKRQTSFGSQLWWTWELDQTQYPGWNQMVADFAAQGIDVLTYVNPFLADASAKPGPPIRNLYAEAAAQGFLVKDASGQPYIIQTVGFPVAMVDLTNPAARDWYAQVIATDVLGVGAKGFMADFGEALPFDSVLYDGTALQQHNRYPQLWAQTVRQACDLAGQPDCLAFMRSSYLSSPQSVPMMWAGDQMVDFAAQDGLASAVLGMLSGGVSGFPLWHSDIGGYTSINAFVEDYVRPPELNARWAEMQAFGTMMRTHEGNRPQVNQQVYDTPETRAQFAHSTKIYAALRQYRADVLQEAVDTGLPAMRHGWLVYPGTAAAHADMQFFLGSHLLVAPVVNEGATSVDVTFPPGTWVHAFTGQSYEGNTTATVAAPVGSPAAFVAVGDPVGDEIRAALRSAGLTTS